MPIRQAVLASTCAAFVAVAPAWGQTVTLEDLRGSVIEATLVFEQHGLANGRFVSDTYRVDRQMTFGSGDTVQDNVTRTVEGAKRTRRQSGSGSYTLGQAREVSNFGGGHVVYLFSNGALTILRTYKEGGQKVEIAFTRDPAGIGCSIRAPYAREKGGDVQMTGLFGAHLQHWTQKQISSSCRVSKR